MIRDEAQLWEANTSTYGGSENVESYLTRPYHQLRLALCCKRLEECLRGRFPDLPSAELTVLDIGSSTGLAGQILATVGIKAIAADIEHEPLRVASGRGLQCVQIDAGQGLPFGNESLNGIVMGEVIEHLFDTLAVLRECYRVLKPGGIIAITTPNLASMQDRVRFIFGQSPRQINPLHSYLKLHIRPFTYSLLRQALEAAGFGGCSVRSNYVVWRCAENRIVQSRFLARLFPTLGGSLIVLACKDGHTGPVSMPREG